MRQYKKDYSSSLFFDYSNIDYRIFLLQLGGVGGNIGEVFQLRHKLVNGLIKNSDERKQAYSVATPAIKEYLKQKTAQAEINSADIMMKSMQNRLN